jgi:orotidine-5'-phosphate decarboxylase
MCGVVVGATCPQELEHIRFLAPDLPFLAPGVGAQGGDLAATVRHGPTASGLGPVVNASRSILYASGRKDFCEAARAAAIQLRDEINVTRNQIKEK